MSFEFAKRVFGPNGLPKLRVLAIGDFSYDCRYNCTNRLLCRAENESGWRGHNFRLVTDDDYDLLELVESEMDMLSACASSPFMEEVVL